MKVTRNDIEIAMTTLANPSGAWREQTVFAHIERAGKLARELRDFMEKQKTDEFALISVNKTVEGRIKPEDDHAIITQLAEYIATLTPFQYSELRIMILAQPKLGDLQDFIKS